VEEFLGMSAGCWRDLQLRWDLCHAHEQNRKDLDSIKPYTAAPSHEPARPRDSKETPEISMASLMALS
jgi:plasmid maintenance system antidote protein VapI